MSMFSRLCIAFVALIIGLRVIMWILEAILDSKWLDKLDDKRRSK